MHKHDLVIKVQSRDGKTFKPIATVNVIEGMRAADVELQVIEIKLTEIRRRREAGLRPPVFEVQTVGAHTEAA